MRLLALAFVATAILALPGAAAADDPIMPLGQVRAGMKCTALSVVRGTTISSFDAEVLDVVTGDPYSSGSRILVKVSGPAVDESGVGEGFSGSPLLCPDGRGGRGNIGAISEAVGDFGNDLALVTPIEQMLGQGPSAPRSARRDPALLAGGRRLATPLTVSGLSGPMRAGVERAARRAKRTVLTAPSGPAGGFPVQELRPGAAVAAGISTGDIGIGQIGTVTFRSGPSIWAFGHPIDGAGRRALPLQDAYVFSVIENPVNIEDARTRKFAVSGHTVGALTNDFDAGVAGRLGPPPTTIPFRAVIRDQGTGRSHVIRTEVSDERSLELGSALDMVGTFALGQGSGQALGSNPPRVASRLCLRITVRERSRPLGFCNEYLDQVAPLDDASAAFQLIDAFKFGRLTVRSVSARLTLRRGVREAFLLRARAPRSVKRGRRVRVKLLLQNRRAGRQRISAFYRVPRTTRPGRHVLTLRGAVPTSPEVGLEERLQIALEPEEEPDINAPGPRSLDALADEIASVRQSTGLRGSISRAGAGPVLIPSSKLLIRGKLRLALNVRR